MNYTKQIDYSSLQEYIDCPRKFFFKYILHLRTEHSNLDLFFGSAFHYGLEQAFLQLKTDQNISPSNLSDIASDGMSLYWDKLNPGFDEDISFPKNPGNAATIYRKFFKEKLPSIMKDALILAVESPFTIHLGNDLPVYTGRIDLILETPSNIIIIDHKTAKSVNDTTNFAYYNSLQSDGYLFAASIYSDKLSLALYLIYQIAKTKSDIYSYKVMKNTSLLERSFTDIINYTKEILSNLKVYESEFLYRHDNTYCQKSFPRSPGAACTKYFRTCEYADLCAYRQNAMTWGVSIPNGFIQEEWHPDNVRQPL